MSEDITGNIYQMPYYPDVNPDIRRKRRSCPTCNGKGFVVTGYS